jgi:hypothetical protein
MSAFNAINPSILAGLIGSIQKVPNYSQMMSGFGNSPIVKSFAQMMQSANQANATRGGDILSLLAGQGQSQLAQNQQDYTNQLGQINQSMMSKGLANTSVGNNLDQQAQNQLALNNENVNEKTASNLAGMANSFTQQAPDMGLLAQLLSRGGGSGGGGGGGTTTSVNVANPNSVAQYAHW